MYKTQEKQVFNFFPFTYYRTPHEEQFEGRQVMDLLDSILPVSRQDERAQSTYTQAASAFCFPQEENASFTYRGVFVHKHYTQKRRVRCDARPDSLLKPL